MHLYGDINLNYPTCLWQELMHRIHFTLRYEAQLSNMCVIPKLVDVCVWQNCPIYVWLHKSWVHIQIYTHSWIAWELWTPYKPSLLITYTHRILILHEVIHCVPSWFLANQFEKLNITFRLRPWIPWHFHWCMCPY